MKVISASETKALAGIAGMAALIEGLESERNKAVRRADHAESAAKGLIERNMELEERMYGGTGRAIANSFEGSMGPDAMPDSEVIRLQSRSFAFMIHREQLLDARLPLAVITDGVNLVVQKMADQVREDLMKIAVRRAEAFNMRRTYGYRR